jgi:hypothetical protein
MNRRNILLIAGAVIGIGVLAVLAGLSLTHFNPKSVMPTSRVIEQAYPIDGTVVGLDVQTLSGDVELVLVHDGAARVESRHSENVAETFEVKNGVLTLKQKSSGKSILNFGEDIQDGVTLYLTEDAYSSLNVATASGDVKVSEALSFEKAALATASGDVSFAAKCGELSAATASGDVLLRGVLAERINLATASGEVEMENTSATEKLSVETVSGDVKLSSCDAAELELHSTSGDIEGTLLTPKDFDVKTVSGKIEVPAGVSGAGRCIIETVSGDVELRVAGGVI